MNITQIFSRAGILFFAGRARGGFIALCTVLVMATIGVYLPVTSSAAIGQEATSASSPWQVPVHGKVKVIREFDKPAQKWSSGHRGVDLAVHDGKVYAPADGEITFSGKVVDRTVVTVTHKDGKKSSFEPVSDPLPRGSRVKAGDFIADLNQEISHCSESCAHWGVRDATEEYINPLLLLGLEEPSVLLPIGSDFTA